MASVLFSILFLQSFLLLVDNPQLFLLSVAQTHLHFFQNKKHKFCYNQDVGLSLIKKKIFFNKKLIFIA